jgi:CheY-specific phosphatase CheX
MPSPEKPKPSLFIQTINRYVPEVMQTMVGLSATPGTGIENYPQPSKLKGVTGAIGLSGKVNGIVYTAYSEGLSKHVAKKILGGAAGEQDVLDVVAELTNMITGNLKSTLCDMGYNCTLSIPSVMRGDEVSVSAKNATICVGNDYAIEGSTDPLRVLVFAALEN